VKTLCFSVINLYTVAEKPSISSLSIRKKLVFQSITCSLWAGMKQPTSRFLNNVQWRWWLITRAILVPGRGLWTVCVIPNRVWR